MSAAADLRDIIAEIAAEEMAGAPHGLEAMAEKARKARERGTIERGKLAERLRQENAHDLAQKLDDCGTELRLTCTTCSATKKVEIACKRRWCPACAFLVMRDRLSRYNVATEMMQWPLFVTLTVENTTDPECIRKIRGHWSKMRRRKLIAHRVAGGISTIEITNEGRGWHPHLHILCDCEWLALHVPPPNRRDSNDVKRQKFDHARLELSALWAQVVGQEKAIVLAKRVAGKDALAYSLKYAVKGSDLIDCKDEIAPLIRVLSKSRMISAFGNMHGKGLDDPEDERPACICPACMNETTFIPESIVDMIYRRSYDQTHAVR